MARANRHYLPGYVWHITHRCHKREFLLKFSRDKKRWMYLLFEAKKRTGAFWEDRYHATAVQTGEHLIRCLVYIDLNMVRTGKIQHPSQWEYGGYNEIQCPKQRYSLIDKQTLITLLEKKEEDELITAHSTWVEKILHNGSSCRNPLWTESIAVGDESFILSTKEKLGGKARGRTTIPNNSDFELR